MSEIKESEGAVNTVAGGNVDLTPAGSKVQKRVNEEETEDKASELGVFSKKFFQLYQNYNNFYST